MISVLRREMSKLKPSIMILAHEDTDYVTDYSHKHPVFDGEKLSESKD